MENSLPTGWQLFIPALICRPWVWASVWAVVFWQLHQSCVCIQALRLRRMFVTLIPVTCIPNLSYWFYSVRDQVSLATGRASPLAASNCTVRSGTPNHALKCPAFMKKYHNITLVPSKSSHSVNCDSPARIHPPLITEKNKRKRKCCWTR